MNEPSNSPINKPANTEDKDQHLWRQFCKLGEMMGDGLHNERGGQWIAKEYKKLSKILIPELKDQEKERRKAKNTLIDAQMQKVLVQKKCTCGSEIKQSRSGSMVCYCVGCNQRFVAKRKKAI